jgi:hypothetical protein
MNRSPIYSPASLIFALLIATAGLSATAEAGSKSSTNPCRSTAAGKHIPKVQITVRKAGTGQTSTGPTKPSPPPGTRR